MSVEAFLDTNVLLYAATGTGAEQAKRARAREIMRAVRFAISTQVLQEFYVNATGKAHIKMSPQAAVAWMSRLDGWPCIAVDRPMVVLAARLAGKYQINYWDAAIVAAAEASGAPTLYTEDLSHGQRYGSVTARNPFVEAPPTP